jgi:site-specific DNA-methyltransferase (adenine-specific)
VTTRRIILADNLEVLPTLEKGSVDLIYIDPPFNTRREQRRTRIQVIRDDVGGDRAGFHGRRYRTNVLGTGSFDDRFDDFLGFLEPRLREAHRILSARGSMFVHLDYREVHYCKLLLDGIFGRDCFMNEIIWAYDYGGRTRRRWPAKHDNILWYVKKPSAYTFHYDAIERVPYLAPQLVTAEKARRGKTLTDVWWQTVVPTRSRERTGYPTQKPLAIVERIVRVHSNPGELVLDFFAGSGTLGEAAARLDRGFILIDSNPDAVRTMRRRLAFCRPDVEKLQRQRRSASSKQRGVSPTKSPGG